VSETALVKDHHVDIPLAEDVVLIHTRVTKVTPPVSSSRHPR
jgi:hypothetical protein